MDPTPYTVSFDRSGANLTIYLSGELDDDTVRSLREQLLPHVHRTDERVWVDLAAVTFCGSAGLTSFVRLDELVSANGGRLTLYRPSRQVMRSICLCGLDRFLSISQPRSQPSSSGQLV